MTHCRPQNQISSLINGLRFCNCLVLNFPIFSQIHMGGASENKRGVQYHRAYQELKSLCVSTARLEKGLIRDLRAADSAMSQPAAMATVQAWLKEDAGGSCSDRRAVELLQETWYQWNSMETYCMGSCGCSCKYKWYFVTTFTM